MTRAEIILERARIAFCMDRLVKALNDEGFHETWLMYGVPDGTMEGDVPEGQAEPYKDFVEDDETFHEWVAEFARTMAEAVYGRSEVFGVLVAKPRGTFGLTDTRLAKEETK